MQSRTYKFIRARTTSPNKKKVTTRMGELSVCLIHSSRIRSRAPHLLTSPARARAHAPSSAARSQGGPLEKKRFAYESIVHRSRERDWPTSAVYARRTCARDTCPAESRIPGCSNRCHYRLARKGKHIDALLRDKCAGKEIRDVQRISLGSQISRCCSRNGAGNNSCGSLT